MLNVLAMYRFFSHDSIAALFSSVAGICGPSGSGGGAMRGVHGHMVGVIASSDALISLMVRNVQVTGPLYYTSPVFPLLLYMCQVPLPLPTEERLCVQCGVVDDEVHLLLECTCNEHLRRRYLPPNILQSRSAQSAIDLLNSEDKVILNNVSLFIAKSFKLRTTERERRTGGVNPPTTG